jgi:hypothetical protein
MFGNDGKRRDGNGGWPDWTDNYNGGGPNGNEPVNNFGGEFAVDFTTWQRQMAFDRDGTGNNRETVARSGKDARAAYDNYVNVWNSGSADLRNAVDIQHGFAVRAEEPAPAPVGGGGGGSAPDASPYTDQIEEAADVDPDEITPPGDGLEDTVEVDPSDEDTAEDDATTIKAVDEVSIDTVIDRTPYYDEVEEARVLNNFVPDTPENQVKDPVTGQLFANSAAARKAGITNWVYADDYSPNGGTVSTDAPDPIEDWFTLPTDANGPIGDVVTMPTNANGQPIGVPSSMVTQRAASSNQIPDDAITIFSKANGGG